MVVHRPGGLRFLSLIGLDVLIGAQQALLAAGGRLVLVHPNAITVR